MLCTLAMLCAHKCCISIKFNISHKLSRPTQFLEKCLEILKWLPCKNKSDPFPLLNVAVYWQSSNTEACAKKLSQILANNIDNGGRRLVSKFM